MKKDIRILLVDDHQVVREGLRRMLELEADLEVVGEAADANEALTQVELLSPEVVLMDIKMPGMNGIELTRQLKEKQLACNIIMLTLYDEYLAQAMEAGAMGYLLKEAKGAELTRAIRQVHGGRIAISESIISKRWTEYEERPGERAGEAFMPGHSKSDALLEEVQLVIPPPVDANRLMTFIGQAEEILQSRMQLMVGSWEGSSAITFPLSKPTSLANILNKLGKISEVEEVGEKPLTADISPSLLKKAAAIPRPKGRSAKTIFVILKSD